MESAVVTTSGEARGTGAHSTASVVVATRSRSALLRRCLGAVNAQEPLPLEILVVDNTHGEAAAREVALAAGAQYLVEPIRGVSRARNRGARAAAGEIVAFVDDDAVPASGWLSALVAEFADPLVAAVSGRILALTSPDDGVAGDRVMFGGLERIVLDHSAPDWFERASFGGVGQGSNLAVRHSIFSTWCGFDERLGAGTRVGGMEEHHAFFSLIDRGHRVVYTPAAKVLHPSRTLAELAPRQLRDLTAASFYVALLMAEEPQHRWRAARYALEALRATPRPWRAGAGSFSLPIPRWRKARAQIAGMGLYVLSRRGGGDKGC